MWENQQNPNSFRNFNPYKKKVLKNFLTGFQKYRRGGDQVCLEKIQTEADFFLDGFPYLAGAKTFACTSWNKLEPSFPQRIKKPKTEALHRSEK